MRFLEVDFLRKPLTLLAFGTLCPCTVDKLLTSQVVYLNGPTCCHCSLFLSRSMVPEWHCRVLMRWVCADKSNAILHAFAVVLSFGSTNYVVEREVGSEYLRKHLMTEQFLLLSWSRGIYWSPLFFLSSYTSHYSDEVWEEGIYSLLTMSHERLHN